MPTSNGQVTGRDIRQLAISDFHLQSDSVVTAKIEDLAVTQPKMEDITWLDAVGDVFAADVTVTTTPTILLTVSLAVPSWVGFAWVSSHGYGRFLNSAGADQISEINLHLNGEAAGAQGRETQANGHRNTITMFDVRQITAPGTTLTIDLLANVDTGTCVTNFFALDVLAFGVR